MMPFSSSCLVTMVLPRPVCYNIILLLSFHSQSVDSDIQPSVSLRHKTLFSLYAAADWLLRYRYTKVSQLSPFNAAGTCDPGRMG
jgi:hypothetical protein